MPNPTEAEILNFLEQFFGAGNKFELEKIQQNKGNQTKIRPWVERLTQGEPQSTILPRWRENNRVDWYGIALSERQLRSLCEELMAFVGPTYSTFRGQRAQLNLEDPVEAAVFQFTNGVAVKVCGHETVGGAPAVWKAVERMRRVSDRACRRTSEYPRPTGRVLRDFYMALQAKDRISAEKELQYLLEQHRLGALNLLFLRVQLLAELEKWQELLDLPELPQLLQIRRPFAVTQALLVAVYCTQLQHFENNNAPASAAAYFGEVVFPRYGNLLTVRGSNKRPEVLKLFMLLAVSGNPTRPDLRDQLLAVSDLNPLDTRYLQQLAALLGDPTPEYPTDPIKRAEQWLKAGNYESAFAVLGQISPSPGQVFLLLRCAYELQTLEAENLVIQVFEQLSSEDKATILSSRWNRDYLTKLQGISCPVAGEMSAPELIPTNWIEWFSQVAKNPNWERALQVARQGSMEWDVNTLLNDPTAIKQFTQLQQQVFAEAETVLHNALPYLLAFFQKDEKFPRPEFKQLYRLLLELLVFSTDGADADLSLLNDLAIALFTLGSNEIQYNEIVEYILELWNNFAAPKKIDWILALLDILVMYPCLVEEKRSQLLFAVAETFRRFSERIDDEQWSVFRSLVTDLKLEESLCDLFDTNATETQPEVQGESNVFELLKGQSILIYTLTESAAFRAKKILEASCRDITVYLNHDRGGSDRLLQRVKNCDLIVMVTASAKHAATNFIEANRPSHLSPILFVNSKGSTGILREIRKYLIE